MQDATMKVFNCYIDIGFTDLVLRDHQVHGVRVLPGVAFFDLVYSAMQARGVDTERLELRDVLFSEPVVADVGQEHRVTLNVAQSEAGRWAVRATSRPCDRPHAHARENFACVAQLAAVADIPPLPPSSASAVGERIDLDAAYAYGRAVGIEHFDFMKGRGWLELRPDCLIAEIEPSPLALTYADDFYLHPACLDSATLVPFLAAMRVDQKGLRPFIPIHLRGFRAFAPIRGRFEVFVDRRLCELQDDVFRSDIVLRDPKSGRCLAYFEGLTTKRIRSPESLKRLLLPDAVAGSDAPNDPRAGVWREETPSHRESREPASPVVPPTSAESLVRRYIAEQSQRGGPADDLDGQTNFYDLGLDSADLLRISAALGEHLGVALYPTLLFEHNTVDALSGYLAQQYPISLRPVDAYASDADASPASTNGAAAIVAGVTAHAAAEAQHSRDDDAIAVIGLSGRYADAENVDALWRDILAVGRDCIEQFPASRWNRDGSLDSGRHSAGKSEIDWGSFLPAVDLFDPVAFSISPREAELMDPQERLFLEVASETFSDAGYSARSFAGKKVGVFVGVMWRQYETLGIERGVIGSAFDSAIGEAPQTPMSFSASVANRVSHHFDLRGPSMALDSMCSSSLTALHLACESLRRGESECALAGGVSLILHPSKYLFLRRNKMLSSDGRCRSFGEGGDGYVPGEGVGAVLLKPLAAAIRDGDAVLGVIRATALNHGGRSNGYTVPDPDAQADVIRAALADCAIDPGSLSYIEAHGTGTSLGDPIEIRGLEKAIAGTDDAPGWRCAIGSIKSNLGHLEAAAGIAGLTKVLLQMRYRQLAPSLHTRTLNPHIDFSKNPFVVQRELTDWNPDAGSRRRAGLSSFGAGGSNAHVVIEEYVDPTSRPTRFEPQLIVLSARTSAQLDAAAKRLYAHLSRLAGDRLEPDLESVAYTLASRDDAQAFRAATVVENMAQLREALAAFDTLRWHHGEPGRRRSTDLIRPSMVSRKVMDALAREYASGATIKVDRFWPGSERPRRCSLPVWPFNPRRCWLPDVVSTGPAVAEPIERSTQKVLSSKDALLDHHRVDGVATVPGVALAMMMLDAASPGAQGDARLRDLRWMRMASVAQDRTLVLTTESNEATTPVVRVFSNEGVYAEARVESRVGARPASSIPLAAVRARCVRHRDSESCYRALAVCGLRYGESLRVLSGVHIGDGEALAEILLTEDSSAMRPEVAVLDGALQAIAAVLEEGGTSQRWRPASIGSFECWETPPSRTWAHLRIVERERACIRFDVDLVDAQGRPCASLVGVELRMQLAIGAVAGAHARASRPRTPIRSCGERWVAEPAMADSNRFDGPLLVFEHEGDMLAERLASRLAVAVVVVHAGERFARLGPMRFSMRLDADTDTDHAALIETLDREGLRPRAVVHAWARPVAESSVGRELAVGIHHLSAWIRQWMRVKPTQLRLLYLHPDGEPIHSAIEGLGRTAGREHHAFAFTPIVVDKAQTTLIDNLALELTAVPDPAPIRYEGQQRLCLRRFSDRSIEHAFDALTADRRDFVALTGDRPRPVCLITGGLGGLGQHMARALATEANATVILTGRRTPAEVASTLDTLRQTLPSIEYRQVDVADAAEVEALIGSILRDHGRLDTVVHAAGILRDGLLNRATRADFDAVLAAKVYGAIALDRATKALPLASFVLFSSAAGMLGNPGKAAYAYANRFLDRFAERRSAAVAAGDAYGHSWSIAWPLWRDGGMRVDTATEAMLARSLGMRPLELDDGLDCLRVLPAGDSIVVAFMAGELAQIDAALEVRGPIDRSAAAAGRAARTDVADGKRTGDSDSTGDARIELLRSLLAELLRLDASAVDIDASAEDLGLDRTDLAGLARALQPYSRELLTALRLHELPRIGEAAVWLSPQTSPPETTAAGDGGMRQRQSGPVDPTLPVFPRTAALVQIRRIIADLLGLAFEEIDPDAHLREFGLDSITTVTLVDLLSTAFGAALAPAAVFELERVMDLVDMIDQAGGRLSGHADGALEPAHEKANDSIVATAPSGMGAVAYASSPGTKRSTTAPVRDTDIAIIGMAGRFPGAPDLEGYWRNLIEVRDLIGEIPADRWDWRALDGDALDGPNRTRARWGGFIEGVDLFDAEFFKISPKQAEWMDPQHRLMLEATWQAFADAALDPEQLRGSQTGVFIGIGSTDYHDRAHALAIPAEAQSALGRAHSLLPNRISYLLDLHGPSMPVETACSSALVAVDQAVSALRTGRCDMAIAGGVNLILNPYLSVSFDRAGMLSTRGRCRVFDSSADGYVRGEGLGVVVLKPLAQAIADGDPIRAVISGSAVNHGGIAHALTAPNPKSQARLLTAAYRDAGIDPASIGLIEAHGTGTPLGDPIEVRGLLTALHELHRDYGRERPPIGHCALGSVKANIGHLETAAGIAGLIKAVYCLERGTIPGLAHFQALNPQIDLRDAPLRIAARTEAWPDPENGEPRRAGVSSFGFGGSNAHIVLEEAPRGDRAQRARLPSPVFNRTRFWLGAPTQPLARIDTSSERPATPSSAPPDTTTRTRPAIMDELIDLLARIAKLPRERVDPDADFERYGLDSVLILELNHALRTRFGALPTTVFYKYKTLASLAEHLAREHAQPTPGTHDAGPESGGRDDIAIIGMSGRYPGATDLNALWVLLREGRHAIGEIPSSRWDYRRYYDPEPKPGRIYCRWGGFIEDVECFDAEFFGVAPWLARYMDPQERLFLEQAWACVEDAGYAPTALAGADRIASGERRAPVGVFVGASYNEYASIAADANASRREPAPYNTQTFSIANRVSYSLGLGGPSMVVDTACSASLNAIHLACESVRSGACEMAIAGGVNLSLHPNKYIMLCANRFAASDGRCRAFGEGGQGYVPGEGVGAVLLKPLSAARRDGDAIYAVIKGSAVNHDGKTFGYTVPNPVAQTEVIRAAWQRAGIDPRTISYIEAHGTGTSLGDPIEITGLCDAFAPATSDRQFCAIGSIKSNVGHLEAAAGIASLHKVLLQMRERKLAPTLLHAERINPEIDFATTPFRVQTVGGDWAVPAAQPLRAGISGFGAGGVNAHLLVESWDSPQRTPADMKHGPALFPLSARTDDRLHIAAARLLTHVEATPERDRAWLHDMAYTLQIGREAFASRLLVVAETRDGLIHALRRYLDTRTGDPSIGLHAGCAQAGMQAGTPANIATWSARWAAGAFEDIATDWIAGAHCPWTLAHVVGEHRRLHLPTYPFVGERYWIESDVPVPFSDDTTARPEPISTDAPAHRVTEIDAAALALRSAAPAARASACERVVSLAVAEVLEYAPGRLPDPQQGLFDMGLESVQSAVLVIRLEQALGLTLYPTIVFDHPSIRELANELMSRIAPTPEAAMRSSGDAKAVGGEIVLAAAQWQSLRDSDGSIPVNWLSLAASPRLRAALAVQVDVHDDEALHALTQSLDEAPLVVADFALLGPGLGAPEEIFAHCFELSKRLLPSKRKIELIWPHALDAHGESSPAARGLAGFARALTMESPKIHARLLGVDARLCEDPERLAQHVLQMVRSHRSAIDLREWRGRREQRVLVERLPTGTTPALRPGSVVLISGGLGQLGLMLAEHLGRAGARLALLGRSALTPAQRERLDAMMAAGVECEAFRADVSVESEAHAAVAAAVTRFGSIDVVVHAAGCLRDGLLIGKRREDAAAVLAPKVAGYRHLDAATATLGLRCFVLFSSTAGLTGNVGQTDYAFANACLDGFAHARAQAVAEGRRRGRCIVIDWPLWAEGGMQVDGDVLDFMALRAGFLPMPSVAGLALFDAALHDGEGQFSVFHGDAQRIRSQFLHIAQPVESTVASEIAALAISGNPLPTPAQAADEDAIAIVGMACRFPGGCDSIEALWALLCAGEEAIVPMPQERAAKTGFANDAQDAPFGGFLREDPALFDAGLFGISPREAADMDPQQRLLLEVAWHALESAGIAADRVSGSDAGVFVGITGSEYGQLPRSDEALNGYTVTGVAANVAAGRLARMLGVHGPTLTVDTACSSSLMAVHLARQSLLMAETSLTVVGGVNMLLSPSTYLALSRMGALAADGRCKTFSADADGYGRAEGCGVIVLERLADARRLGHPVLAVLHGSAANHDGASSGLTVPNGRAQARLLERALANAGLDPAEVEFVEAHGTGTPLGDPIELGAIAEVYGRRPEGRPLTVGAVKANLGHLEAAAGIAGLIKAVLCVRHGWLPAQPGLHTINPRIGLLQGRIDLARSSRAWNVDRRIAGVSAFGFSGTNVHVLVGSSQPMSQRERTTPRWQAHMLCLSAASAAALSDLAQAWRTRLSDMDQTVALGDLCAASQTHRARFRHRAAIVGSNAQALVDALDACVGGQAHPAVWRSEEAGANGMVSTALHIGQTPVASTLVDSIVAVNRAAAEARISHRALAEGRMAGRTIDARIAARIGDCIDASAVVCALRDFGLRPDRVLAHGEGLAIASWAAGAARFEEIIDLLVDGIAPAATETADASLIDVSTGTHVALADLPRLIRAASDGRTMPPIGEEGICLSLGASVMPGALKIDDPSGLTAALAALYVHGLNLDCADMFGTPCTSLPIPRYPFQRRRYWIADHVPDLPQAQAPSGAQRDSAAATVFDPIWIERKDQRRVYRYAFSHARLPHLADNHGVLHIGQYLELLSRALRREFPDRMWRLADVEFRSALRLDPAERRELELILEGEETGLAWCLQSPDGGSVHARGVARASTGRAACPETFPVTGDGAERMDRGAFYGRMKALSFDLGPSVRWIESVAFDDGYAHAEFAADPAMADGGVDQMYALGFHPGMLDAGAQLVAVAAAELLEDRMRFMVVGMDGVHIDAGASTATRARLRMLQERDGLLRAQMQLIDANGRVAFAVDALSLRRLSAQDLARIDGPSHVRQRVVDARSYVHERIAAALEMDPAELHPQIPLRELGLDSIVGLGLVRELRDGLGMEVPAELLLAGPSIEELLEKLRVSDPTTPVAAGNWFEYVVRREQPRVRLVCLPFGAGAASAYRRWSALDPSIEVWPVQLPGRETRMTEQPFDDLERLLDALEVALPDDADIPVALYGQSMGGFIAFELARRLQNRDRSPIHLFVGGLSAPDIRPNPYLDRLCARMRERGIEHLPPVGSLEVPDAFWEVFRELPEAAEHGHDHLRPILPMVLADLALVSGYRYRHEPMLQMPITVLHGRQDDRVPHESLAGWLNMSGGGVRIVELEGDHFFISDTRAWPALSAEIHDVLLSSAASSIRHNRVPPCFVST